MEFTRSAGPNHESLGTLNLYNNDKVVAEGPMKTQAGQVHPVRWRPVRRL